MLRAQKSPENEILALAVADFLAMQGFQYARLITAAHRNPLAIEHDHRRLSIVLGSNFLNVLEVYDEGTMNAQKLVRIQSLLEVRHGFP